MVTATARPPIPITTPTILRHEHGHLNNKLAMWLFLSTECLLFGALISTYLMGAGQR